MIPVLTMLQQSGGLLYVICSKNATAVWGSVDANSINNATVVWGSDV